jgi:hypothetical protein
VQGPHMSLRIRHEAARARSRAHIKHIRLLLNQLLGEERGREVVTNAKMVASQNIEESHIMEELKGEVDEIHGGLGNALDRTTGIVTPVAQSESAQSTVAVDFPQEISSNVHDSPEVALARFEALMEHGDMLDRRRLVHYILLTDPSDFHTLSWNGANAHQPETSPEEFMVSFLPPATLSAEEWNSTAKSTSAQLAQSTRLAFFHQVVHDTDKRNFESARELLKELHKKMRSLIPSRKELHSHINDEEIIYCSISSDNLSFDPLWIFDGELP